MPTIPKLFRNRDKPENGKGKEAHVDSYEETPIPKIIRTTTTVEETIFPPASPPSEPSQPSPITNSKRPFRLSAHFRRVSGSTARSARPPSRSVSRSREEQELASYQSVPGTAKTPGDRTKRLSARLERLHIRSPSRTVSSESLAPSLLDDDKGLPIGELAWEERAILLAGRVRGLRDSDTEGAGETRVIKGSAGTGERSLSTSTKERHDEKDDEQFQQAIQLHEAGDYKAATALFARLASPMGSNHPSAQIFYSLSLRHGWGISPSPSRSLHFLALAANSAADAVRLESLTKPETHLMDDPSTSTIITASRTLRNRASISTLRLALFELANSFRFGFGIPRDAVSARTYYETSAELGDTDAMAEAAWCFVEGFGGAKDKKMAARFLRMAEARGVQTVGGSWIWKDKYNEASS